MSILDKITLAIENAIKKQLGKEVRIERLCMTSGETGGDHWLLAHTRTPLNEFIPLVGCQDGEWGNESVTYEARFRGEKAELSGEISELLNMLEIGYDMGQNRL